jgi:hypothetical protein
MLGYAEREAGLIISVYELGVLGPFRSFLRTLDNYQQSAY